MAGVSWSTILNLAPKVVMGLLPGLVNRGVAGAAEKALSSTILKGGAYSYPEMPSDFWYKELAFGGQRTSKDGKETVLPAMNGETMGRANINAVLAQTLEDHNRAIQLHGTDKDLKEWWPGEDNEPRLSIVPKSTAVQGIAIDKDNNVMIQFRGGGKWYRYKGGRTPREASEAVKDLLTYPSIGRALPRKGKYAWKDSKHLLDKKGTRDKNVGQWGRDHYNPGWFAGPDFPSSSRP